MFSNLLFLNLLTLKHFDHKNLYFSNIKNAESDRTQNIVLTGENSKRSIYDLHNYKTGFYDCSWGSMNRSNVYFSVKGILLENDGNCDINRENILESIVSGILFVHISICPWNNIEEINIIKGDLSNDRYTIEDILSREIKIDNFYVKVNSHEYEYNHLNIVKTNEKDIMWQPIEMFVYSPTQRGRSYKDFQRLKIYNLKFQNEIKCYRMSHSNDFQKCKVDGNILTIELINECIKSKEEEQKNVTNSNQHTTKDDNLSDTTNKDEEYTMSKIETVNKSDIRSDTDADNKLIITKLKKNFQEKIQNDEKEEGKKIN